MDLNTDAKFVRKLICVFKNDMSNLENFHQGKLEILKIGTL